MVINSYHDSAADASPPTFTFENQGDMFVVYANWKGEKRRLVTGDIEGNVFTIDDFLYSTNKTLKLSLAKVAKEKGRTLAGMIMESIKKGMPENTVLKIDTDDWRSTVGGEILKSPDLKNAAQTLLGEPKVESKQAAQDYLINRYSRLYPADAEAKEKMPQFLTNIKNCGWFGAWLPKIETKKEEVISTA